MYLWCLTLTRHAPTRYTAWLDGVQVVVYTCKCGRKQHTRILPANRVMRRAAR
jgi:hypothetical protein